MRAYIITTSDNHGRKADLTNYPTALPTPELFYGVTPDTFEVPEWWLAIHSQLWANDKPERVFCCGKSKELLLRQHIANYPEDDLLLMEDDVFFTSDADEKYNAFMQSVSNWDMIFLGGWHEFNCRGCPPREIAPNVLRCFHVLGNEAVIIRSALLQEVAEIWTHSRDNVFGHSDWQLVAIQQRYNTFAPMGFIAGQQNGWSNLFQADRQMGIKNDFFYKGLDERIHLFGYPENNCKQCKNKCCRF